jgi:hypothetical protein
LKNTVPGVTSYTTDIFKIVFELFPDPEGYELACHLFPLEIDHEQQNVGHVGHKNAGEDVRWHQFSDLPLRDVLFAGAYFGRNVILGDAFCLPKRDQPISFKSPTQNMTPLLVTD